MRTILIFVALIVLGYLAWTATTNRDNFLYWQARMAIAWLKGEAPESVTRMTDTRGRRVEDPAVNERTGIFVAYGQSNSANFGEKAHVVRGAVYNFLDGEVFAYQDPALGGDGFGGSVWGIVGDGLIEDGQYDAVIIAPAGFASKTIAQLGEGHLYEFFKRQYQGLMAKYGRVDGILFHQGEENHRTRTDADYEAGFERLWARMKADGIDAPFYMSQASYCGNSVDEGLIAAQDRIIRTHDGVLRGPNTDLLTDDRYRRDGCHFSAEGLRAFAAQWVEAIAAGSENQAH